MKYTEKPSIDKAGKSGKVYIDENGMSFKDPQGKERIDVGTTVFTNDGPYTLTTSGGVKTQRGIYDDMKNSFDASLGQLDVMNKANQDAIRARTESQVQRINDQKRMAQQDYRNANTAAYQAYVEASNPYGAAAEQQAKLGLNNSGYSESSKMRVANTYQNAINKNILARNEYINELETARREALYKGDIDAANALNEYARLVYEHGIDTAEKLANQGNLAYNTAMARDDNAWNRAKYLEERDYERAQAEKKNMWDRAVKLTSLGFSNEEIARNLGVSLAELNQIQRMYR